MSYTYQEISNQPNSWAQTIQAATAAWSDINDAVRIEENTQFLFIGCGTSLYLSQSAAALFQELTGHVSKAVPGSEVFLSPASVVSKTVPTVAFVISRSGTTSEALFAAKFLMEHYADNVQVVGVTCNRGAGSLSELVSLCIVLEHASEKSVVMTQSFTNMLLALQVIAAQAANRVDVLNELHRLPEALRSQLPQLEQFGQSLAQDLSRNYYVFLGLGKYYGLANEANLKLKEMTQVPSEAYNPLEFRHGPISMLTPASCVVLMRGNEAAEYLVDVEKDVTQYGVTLGVLSPENLQGDFSDWSRTVLYMPALQYLAYYKATLLGLTPDEPRNLTQVVVIGSK